MSKATLWTPGEDQIISQYAAGCTVQELNDLLPNRSSRSILGRLKRLSIKKSRPPRKQRRGVLNPSWLGGEIYTLKMYRHLSPNELNEKFIYRHPPEDIAAKKVELGLEE